MSDEGKITHGLRHGQLYQLFKKQKTNYPEMYVTFILVFINF